MRRLLLAFLLMVALQQVSYSQKIENIIIITTDGLRWQEVFGGMDSAIANNSKFNQGDSSGLFYKYWSEDASERRSKLMPFFWSTIVKNGQLYGNRNFDNKVDNANPHWFSFPGYHELFTGYPDEKVNSNRYMDNPNTTVLEFLQKQPAFKNRIAAFASWEAFNRILNEPRAGFPVIAGHDSLTNSKLTSSQVLLQEMNRNSGSSAGTHDLFTHYQAVEYLKSSKPKVLAIGYGETDHYAHEGKYRSYLNAANQFDKWIKDIWTTIQSMPQYKNKTALFITTDHGRGDKVKSEWTNHGEEFFGSNQMWFTLMGPGVAAKGEIKTPGQYYQKQFAQTIASMLGVTFVAEHPVGEKITEILQ